MCALTSGNCADDGILHLECERNIVDAELSRPCLPSDERDSDMPNEG